MDNDLMGGFGAELERHDRDRYLATLYAPAAHRSGLAALLAFSLDIARLRETVSQPLLAQIRLQWWRDALAEIAAGQPPKRHPILGVLAPLLSQGRIEAALLERMIDARERDWDELPPADLSALDGYIRDTGGALSEARLQILGSRREEDVQAVSLVGSAWTLTGLIRAVPFLAAQGRVMIPTTIMAESQLDPHTLLTGKDSPALRRAIRPLADHANGLIALARAMQGVSRTAIPVLAEARVAGAYLKRLAKLDYNVFDARLGEPDTLAAWRLGLARITGRY